MNPVLKNILAFIVGAIVGSIVNGALISISGSVIPPPEGVDVNNPESIKASIHLYESKHFIFPFLAHALGTFVGAVTAYLLAATAKMKIAIGIGVLFLLGGIAACFMIPAPTWFIALDLIVAYIPMGYLGGKVGGMLKK
ncbi:hypothetical protein [Flavobacterium sp.]|uniref:hypothetical protein n=1 Tax=Flavobacterium sp. TaxID=239 RepID=UPI0028BE130D|nr:hypothetical protein [Flavobacterium sp.]